MKTLFKLLMGAAFLFSASAGYSQCNAAFTTTDEGLGQFDFQSTAYPGGDSSAIFTWSFGDGTGDSILGDAGVFHSFAATDSFTVCLTINDTVNHCTVQQCQRIFANLCSNAAGFFYTQVGFGAYEVGADFGLQNGYSGIWNFGDGNTGAGSTVYHQYTASGSYNLCYKVSGPGCADSSCQSLPVTLCQFSGATYYVDTVSYNPLTIKFLVNNPLPGNTYQWHVNDWQYANGDSAIYSFPHTGSDTLVLYDFSGPTGCWDSVVSTFGADRCGLNPYVSQSSNGLVMNASEFFLDSTGQSSITTLWTFPGGSPASTSNPDPTVNYASYGNYTDTLYLMASSGCIDTFIQSFAITPGYYSIGGQITAGTDAGTGTVYLVTQDSVGKLALFDSTTITWQVDSGNIYGGSYAFNNLLADTYYLKAALNTGNPDYANYLPTYYTSSLSWSTATPVIITNNNLTADITLSPGTNPGGPGFVAGYVSQGAGLVLQQGGNNLTRGVGDALSGVQINLLTDNDVAVAYTFTDVNGNYHFSNLAYGSYYIYAEELNKQPVHIPFTLSASDSSINNLNLSINSDSSYATAINNVNQISVAGIYPNPVVNKLEVQLSSAQTADATIKLIDMLGQTAIANNTKLTTGNNHLEMDMTNLTAGVYNLIIQTNGQHLTYKVVKAK